MTSKNDVSGAAALASSESLLLFVGDRTILPEKELSGALKDETDAVAVLIQSIIDCGNSVRRSD